LLPQRRLDLRNLPRPGRPPHLFIQTPGPERTPGTLLPIGRRGRRLQMDPQMQKVQYLLPSGKVPLSQRSNPLAPVAPHRPTLGLIESSPHGLRRHPPAKPSRPLPRGHRRANQPLRPLRDRFGPPPGCWPGPPGPHESPRSPKRSAPPRGKNLPPTRTTGRRTAGGDLAPPGHQLSDLRRTRPSRLLRQRSWADRTLGFPAGLARRVLGDLLGPPPAGQFVRHLTGPLFPLGKRHQALRSLAAQPPLKGRPGQRQERDSLEIESLRRPSPSSLIGRLRESQARPRRAGFPLLPLSAQSPPQLRSCTRLR
jgi:hypothetical protein